MTVPPMETIPRDFMPPTPAVLSKILGQAIDTVMARLDRPETAREAAVDEAVRQLSRLFAAPGPTSRERDYCIALVTIAGAVACHTDWQERHTPRELYDDEATVDVARAALGLPLRNTENLWADDPEEQDVEASR